MGQVGQVQLIKANVTSAEAVSAALRGASATINLVGVLRQSGRQRFSTLHTKAAGVIARTARAVGVESLVHVSSAGIEDNRSSQYARTKLEGEQLVRDAFPAATILRPSIVFGAEDNFFNRFAALATISPWLLPALPLIGGGKTKFQPVYVGDVADAIVASLFNDNAAGKTYELGGPAVYTFRDLIEMILLDIGRRRRLMSVPFGLATLQAMVLQLLPNAPLTVDQVRLLKHDNVVAPGANNLSDLGIEAQPLQAVLPTYLWRFRREGQFEGHAGRAGA
jgi:NADH dehydrogenase